jgi:WD40 repeat protein
LTGAGERFSDALRDTLDRSRNLIAVFGQGPSKWVETEQRQFLLESLGEADSGDRLFIPVVRGRPESLPRYAAQFHYVDASDSSAAEIAERLGRQLRRDAGFVDERAAAARLTWHETAREKIHGGPVTFSPDGKSVAVPYGTLLQLADSRKGKPRRLFPQPSNKRTLVSPRLSPDGRCVAAATMEADEGAPAAWVWELGSLDQLQAVPNQLGHEGPHAELLFSHTGRYFAAPQIATLVWDTLSWATVWAQYSKTPQPMAFGAGDKWIAATTAGSVVLWDLPDARQPGFESKHDGAAPITGIDAHPTDESLLLSAAETSVYLHRRSDDVRHRIELPAEWRRVSARFSPSGKYVVVGTAGEEDARQHHLFDATTLARLAIPRFGAHRFLEDDRLLVVFARGTATLWDLDARQRRQQITAATPEGIVLGTELLGLSGDGRYVATGRARPLATPSGPLVQVWDLQTGVQAIEFDFPALWCALSPTELCVAAAGDEEIRDSRNLTVCSDFHGGSSGTPYAQVNA